MPDVNPHFKMLLDTCIQEGVPETVAACLYTHSPTERLIGGTFPSRQEPGLDELNLAISKYKQRQIRIGGQTQT